MKEQQPKLAIVGPQGVEVLTPPSVDPITIGRDPACAVILESEEVSRLHCQLERLPSGRHRVVDLDSSNGLQVNGRRVPVATLAPFDRIALGEFELVYLDPRTDPDEVIEILSQEAAEGITTLRPPKGASLRERLLWLVLTLQELCDEEDLAPLLDALFDELLRDPALSRGLLLIIDDTSAGGVSAIKLRNAPPDHVRAEALGPYRTILERVSSGDRVVVESTPLEPAGLTICVPLRSHGRRSGPERRRFQLGSIEGALLLATKEDLRLDPEERRLLRALARQVAVLLSSARLQRQASVDALTALSNRAHTEEILREELGRARKSGQRVGLLLIDLDDFKHVNDTLGHQVGDEVLREVGKRIKRSLRITDFAGRWGGEEFLAILPGTDEVGAVVVAEKFLEELRATPVSSQSLDMTASVGVACYPEHGEAALLVDRADIALYRAKNEGKDRAVLFRAELEAEVSGGRTRKFSRTRNPDGIPAALDGGVLLLGRDGRLRYRESAAGEGAFKNDVPIAGLAELADGDRLMIGPYVFTVRIETEPGSG